MCVGLWPYERKIKRFVLRAVFMGSLTLHTIPQLISIFMHCEDTDRLMLSTVYFTGLLGMIIKMLGMILEEEKMKAVHRRIVNNWQWIEEYGEREILYKYSERGRTLTIFYFGVIAATFPLCTKILDFIKPLKNPRANIYVSGGEYFFDRETQFLPIFVADYLGIVLLASIFTVIDTMYYVIAEHCCALYAVIRSRLLELRLKMQIRWPVVEDIDSYEWVRGTIQFHQDALIFTSLLNDSYSASFMFTLVAALYVVPLNSCAITANLDNPLQLVPYAVSFGALMIHGLLISYPEQRIIDHQLSLLDAAYCNECYAVPLRTKKLLLVFMLRCSEPVILTADDLRPINFEVYFKIMKTALFYVTVESSFR